MTISAEKTEIRRGFPIYLSGASNPKGSGAQCCSPPNTVIGIETYQLAPGEFLYIFSL